MTKIRSLTMEEIENVVGGAKLNIIVDQTMKPISYQVLTNDGTHLYYETLDETEANRIANCLTLWEEDGNFIIKEMLEKKFSVRFRAE